MNALTYNVPNDAERNELPAECGARAFSGFGLVSSCDGAITRLLITIPSSLTGALKDTYLDVFSNLPQHISPVVATNVSSVSIVSNWLMDGGIFDRSELVALDDSVMLSVWTQDFCLAFGGPHHASSTWLATSKSGHSGDAQLVDALKSVDRLRHIEMPQPIDGGNLLVGDEFLLVGADSAKALSRISARLPTAFRHKEVHIIGRDADVPEEAVEPTTIVGEGWTVRHYWGNRPGTRQPLFHIDLFVTLAGRATDGRSRILVGDPSAAANLLRRPIVERMMQPIFDQIADDLAGNGFQVIRNPLPLAYMDEPDKRLRTWYFASSNNAWVQNCDRHGNVVWLPSYGHGNWPELTATDRANADIWRSLGYEVRMIRNCQPLAENRGGLHCLGKILSRRVSASRLQKAT